MILPLDKDSNGELLNRFKGTIGTYINVPDELWASIFEILSCKYADKNTFLMENRKHENFVRYVFMGNVRFTSCEKEPYICDFRSG